MFSGLAKVIITILCLRGILGIYQDRNYFFNKPFNKETIKGWFQSFKRTE